VGTLDRHVAERDATSPGFAAAVAAKAAGIRRFDRFVNAALDEIATCGVQRDDLTALAQANAVRLGDALADVDLEVPPSLAHVRLVAGAIGLHDTR
jgi:hypothetical protein